MRLCSVERKRASSSSFCWHSASASKSSTAGFGVVSIQTARDSASASGVVGAGDVSDVGSELEVVVQLPRLAWRVVVGGRGDGVGDRLVIGEDDERSPLHGMSEMFDGEEDGEELSSKGAVAPLGLPQAAGEEPERLPRAIHILLQHRSNTGV